ncbi:MAG: transposase, partial [Proteobacteria bacterium]|nr:transposase [Pseudomonadota bacterium]
FKGPQCVARSGFSLHAARQIHREDRQGLSQLINYMARPPIAEERLTRHAAGDIEYRQVLR